MSNSDNAVQVIDLPQRPLRNEAGQYLAGSDVLGASQSKSCSTWRRAFAAAVSADDIQDVALRLLAAARRDEPWAIQEILDRCLGKPVQAIDVSSDGDNVQRYDARVAEESRRITAVLIVTGHSPLTVHPPSPQGNGIKFGSQEPILRDAQAETPVIGPLDAAGTSAASQDAPGSTPTMPCGQSVEAPAAGAPTASASDIQALEAARAAAAAMLVAEAEAWRERGRLLHQARTAAKRAALPRYPCHKPGCPKTCLKRGGYCASHTLQAQRASGLDYIDWREAEAVRLAAEAGPHPFTPRPAGVE